MSSLKDIKEQANKLNSLCVVDLFDRLEFNNLYNKPVIMLILRGENDNIGHYVYFNSVCDGLDNKLYYFDSFGVPPLKLFVKYPHIAYNKEKINEYINFIKSFDSIDYNEHEYQDPDASTCGQYCLLFLVLNANKNLDPDNIYILLKHFIEQSEENIKYSPPLISFDDRERRPCLLFKNQEPRLKFDNVMLELLGVLNN